MQINLAKHLYFPIDTYKSLNHECYLCLPLCSLFAFISHLFFLTRKLREHRVFRTRDIDLSLVGSLKEGIALVCELNTNRRYVAEGLLLDSCIACTSAMDHGK